ncbi:MAG: SET domain-containing protein-lysine N-methyltransferase [Candidatus Magasanikbacteria bacterium]|nr:SET domain-containing protein-lysine N-methyltransferase [Candidatus Magasanikbacteria bacterium]
MFFKFLEIKKSSIAGKGIFSNKNFKKGEVIFTVHGPIVKYSKDPDWRIGEDWLQISQNAWKIPYRDNPWIFINHSCQPNVGLKGTSTVVAIRSIYKNEEIVIDYSWTEASEKGWHMICHCGAPNCRKLIQSVQFLPVNIFKKYRQYIPAYLRSRYIKNKVYEKRDKKGDYRLYAKDVIKKNELVFQVEGTKITYPKSPNYKIGYKWLGIGKREWIIPYQNNPWCFFRHSCTPNVGLRDRDKVVAMRKIRANEEITIDDSISEVDVNWSMTCACGAKNCRKIIRSIQYLPLRLFQRYKSYIPPLFKKVYKEYNNYV